MSNKNFTLYTGVTNDLLKRVNEHKTGIGSTFTSKYKLTKLVYYEFCESIQFAIIREKQIKDMNRIDKIELIKKLNPTFSDLYESLVKNK